MLCRLPSLTGRRGFAAEVRRSKRNRKRNIRGGLRGLKDYMDRSRYKLLNPFNPLIHVIPL
jgi:hypothetical protein